MKISKFIALVLLLSFIAANAQTNRFYYNISFKQDSLSDVYSHKVSVLDITKNKVKFYPEDFLIKDSIRKNMNIYGYSYNNFNYQLIRDKNSNINENYVTISPNYYSYPTEDIQKWNITKELKNINGLQLQKAKTFFGGRHWEAWFAASFPFQEGPYKFRGLPGLIIELKDDKEQFIFQLAKNVNIPTDYDTSFYLENLNELKPLRISEEALKKLRLDYFLNPLKDYNNQTIMVQDQFGNTKKVDSRDLTLRQQQQLKKNNNPIELDKAIHYP
jgi:GLPGLI family protein